MSAERKQPENPEDVPTTGHSWDGIQEFDNPMPRWWLWSFYATIVFSVIYMILFPAWPLISGATPGLLGWSSRHELRVEMQRFDQMNAPLDQRLVATDIAAVSADPELGPYATARGAAVFRTWCAQCHGSGAQGAVGFPSLLDDDWLWGGDIEAIHATVAHGIRSDTDADTRFSQMPAFGEMLTKPEIEDVVQFVRQISGQPHDASLAAAGATLFADNCASCHGAEGYGDRTQGAPDLTDAIWLFGGDEEAIRQTVTRARYGVMPAWQGRLSEPDVRAVSVYVHQLGGGE